MSVDKPNKQYDEMSVDWEIVDALMNGTRHMREAGKKFLPQRLLEHDDDYKARLEAATLYPAFSDTVGYMVGRIFADPVVTNDDVPDWVKTEVLENVDMQGLNLHSFLGTVMNSAMQRGLCHVLVDSPPEVARTREEQKALALRPYAMMLDAKRVIGWQTDGKGKLTQLRVTFNEVVNDPATFSEATVERIRVYEIGSVRVFEKRANSETRKTEWIELTDQRRAIALDVIPLVTFYTGRTGFMTARPPLMELAHLNIKHWQMQSSNDDLVETAQVPILTAIGIQDKKPIQIGARSAINLPANGSLKYVEHTGAAISAGRTALDNLKEEMRDAGARLLVPMTQVKTATQAGEEAARENSALAQMVRDLEKSAASMLDLIAMFRSEEKGGTVKAQPNLDPELEPISAMDFLLRMATAGNLSQETLFNEAKRRGVLSEDIDWEDEQTKIMEDAANFAANNAVTDPLDPNNPQNTPPQNTPPQNTPPSNA